MKKFFPLACLMLLASVPVLAQSTTYSFDNFDTHNGVKIYIVPPAALPAPLRSRRRSRSLQTDIDPAQASSNKAPASDLQRLVKPTVLISDSVLTPAANGSTGLRGYTTGSAELDRYLLDSSRNHGVDPLLIYSIMHQESSFKSHAVSPKGARGLMQLMPGTAIRYGVTNVFDSRQNIEGGARYLRFLLDYFDNDIDLVLAGYNAGEGAVEKYGWQVPPYAETREYVRRISRRYALLRDPNAPLYAPRLTGAQLAKMQAKQSEPLTVYERTVISVRLPDGRLQLMSQ
ncbi:MAG: hypothetical protein DMF71_11095 [Acidobacteria bacterium]|nr:MAG: hypothetical protein DMF71_11095 [Acidobacteriota bacterium]